MCKSFQTLTSITPQRLDDLLAEGWFRMQQSVFTTRYLQHDGQFYETVWLRHRLEDFGFPDWFLRLEDKEKFRVEVTPGPPAPAHEILYQKYRADKPLDWANSLEEVLYGEETGNIFNTRVMNLYHGEKLVAAGFIDLGNHSAAGICNFYDPAYKKYSLGKFLYYSQVRYCIEQGLQYFYPGYMAPGLAGFDYKAQMHAASLEAYDPITRSWNHFEPIDPNDTAVTQMEAALCLVLPRLQSLGMDARLVVNINFDLNYTYKHDMPYAVFISPPEGHTEQYAITFDPDSFEYYIFDCSGTRCKDSLVPVGQEIFCMEPLELKTPLFMLLDPYLVAETMLDIMAYWNED